jgi:CheY-like chemotaxis protein
MSDSPEASHPPHRIGAAWILRIFVVENHEDTRFLLTYLLRQLGHTVESAGTMSAALEGLRAGSFDVMLSDVGLPDGSGWELMANLESDNRPPYAIAMSGFGSPSDCNESLAAGYRHHLLKPMQHNQLEHLLDEAGEELFAGRAG